MFITTLRLLSFSCTSHNTQIVSIPIPKIILFVISQFRILVCRRPQDNDNLERHQPYSRDYMHGQFGTYTSYSYINSIGAFVICMLLTRTDPAYIFGLEKSLYRLSRWSKKKKNSLVFIR